jgi:hypothetical protein
MRGSPTGARSSTTCRSTSSTSPPFRTSSREIRPLSA